MSWQTIARRDASVTVPARSVKILLALLVAGLVLAGYLYPIMGIEPYTTARFSGFAHGMVTTLVPFVGLLLGYNAVVRERESGAIRLTLALPDSRRDLVLGTYASRTGVLSATILVALAVAGALVVYPFGELELVPYLGYVGLVLAFGAIWSGLGIAVSLAVSTSRRALVVGFGLLFLFVIVWDGLEGALTAGLGAAGLIDGALPDVVQILLALEPGRVLGRVSAGFVDPGRAVGEAWYLNEWIAVVVFALWVIGPIGIAYARFAGSDLA